MAEESIVSNDVVAASPLADDLPPAELSSESFGVSETPVSSSGMAAESEIPIDAKEFGFDDDSVNQYDFEYYKGRKGQTDRLGIIRDAGPFGARVHYTKLGQLGYVICLSEFKTITDPTGKKTEVPVRLAVCCKKLESPSKRFIVPIIQYTTTPDGKLTQQLGYRPLAWRYRDDKYIAMRTLHSEFPLNKHDLLVTCTNEDWQKLNIQACKESLFRLPKWPAEWKQNIELWAQVMMPKMAKTLGKKCTEQEILERLGMAQAQQAQVVQMDTPVMDLKALLDS